MTVSDLLQQPDPPQLDTAGLEWSAAVPGWTFNAHRLRSYRPCDCVWQVWTNGTNHWNNPEKRNGVKGVPPMYRTREEAFVALAHAFNRESQNLLSGVLAAMRTA